MTSGFEAPNAKRASPVAKRVMMLAVGAWLAVALIAGRWISSADDALTALLLLIALILPAWACFIRPGTDGRSRLDPFQPGALVAAFFLFYTIIPAFHIWRDLGYRSDWIDPLWPPERVFHLTLFISLLGLVAFAIGYRINPARLWRRCAAPSQADLGVVWRWGAMPSLLLMLGIGTAFRLYHLKAFGGLSPTILLYLSPTHLSESGIRFGGIPSFLESLLDWGALLLFFRAITDNKHKTGSLLVLGLAAILAYLLSGKRSAMVPFLLYPVVWLHYLRTRVTVMRGVVYLAVGSVMVTLLLFMRTVVPLLLTQGPGGAAVPADIALNPVQFYLRSPELAIFDMTMFAVQNRLSILHSIGGAFWGGLQYNVAPAAYLIPRSLWPSKPAFIDLGQVFFQQAVGGREDVGFSVGILGGLYVFGGMLGVLGGMLLIGLAFRFTYEHLKPWQRLPRNVFLYGPVLWLGFQFLRFGTLGFTILFFIQFLLVGVLAAFLVLRGTPPSERLTSGARSDG